jgi:hypothetical protein
VKKETHRVGAGITRYEDQRVRYDFRDPAEARQAFQRLKALTSAPFDKAFGPWVRAAERELAEYRAAVGPDHEFRAHDEAGWYCEEMLSRDRYARECAEAGDWQWALFHAAHLGQLLGEARVKFLWEERALLGDRTLEERSRGGGWNRKATADQKIASYRKYRDAGHNKTDATYLAAKELNVAESNIRAARKAAGATD